MDNNPPAETARALGRARGRCRGRPFLEEGPSRRPGASGAGAACPPPPLGGGGAPVPSSGVQRDTVTPGFIMGRGRSLLVPSKDHINPGGVEAVTESLRRMELKKGNGGDDVPEDEGLHAPGEEVLVGRGGSRSSALARRSRDIQQREETVVCTRPESAANTKKGTAGRPTNLIANYFEVTKRAEWTLIQYRVDFEPDEDRVGIRKGLLHNFEEVIGGHFIYDGSSMLYMTRRLEGGKLETTVERAMDKAKVKVKVRLVGEVKPSDHMYLQVFNILLRKTMSHLQLEMVQRHYYDRHASISIPEFDLEIWPGYLTSIRQHENQLLLCAEIHHKVLRRDTVLKQLHTLYNRDRNNYQKLAAEALLGTIVMTKYNSKTYRIDDIDWEKCPADMFMMRDNKATTYVDYYFSRYNERVTEMGQPLLVSRPRKKDVHRGEVECVYLVPELCFMTGLDQSMRENSKLMRAMGQHTHQTPDKKVRVLQRFMSRIHSEPRCMEELAKLDLDFGDHLMKLSGRQLEPETIVLGQDRRVNGGIQADWTSTLRRSSMLKVVNLHNWVVIAPARNTAELVPFLRTLHDAASGMSMPMAYPLVEFLPDVRPQNYIRAIDEACVQCNPQMVMVVLATNRKDVYGAVKKRCYVEQGIASQVVVARTLSSKGLVSIATKIAIQINCKLGGEPWSADIPLKNCMMVGFDVYHNTAQKGTSVGALVASMNTIFTRYCSIVAIHSHQEEVPNFISNNMVQALQKYKQANGRLPSHVILYRSGVGEGQVGYVRDNELAQILAALSRMYGPSEQECKFGFVIVNKRLNTRIMTAQAGNPFPGTIVDDDITLPERFDFYLISQSVRQGTVAPTSYSIIHDTLNLGPDKIQRLTYKMCHLYFNWSSTVRVPAPCQYAHKLAYLVGEYIHSNVHEHLSDTLYFL